MRLRHLSMKRILSEKTWKFKLILLFLNKASQIKYFTPAGELTGGRVEYVLVSAFEKLCTVSVY